MMECRDCILFRRTLHDGTWYNSYCVPVWYPQDPGHDPEAIDTGEGYLDQYKRFDGPCSFFAAKTLFTESL